LIAGADVRKYNIVARSGCLRDTGICEGDFGAGNGNRSAPGN